MAGVLTAEFLDEFPKTTRAGSGQSGPRVTDVDIALENLKGSWDGVSPTKVLKLIDYNVEVVGEGDDERVVEVEEDKARTRASGRIPGIRARGYTTEAGWEIASRNGAVYARFHGEGNVPVKESKPVGEAVPV